MPAKAQQADSGYVPEKRRYVGWHPPFHPELQCLAGCCHVRVQHHLADRWKERQPKGVAAEFQAGRPAGAIHVQLRQLYFTRILKAVLPAYRVTVAHTRKHNFPNVVCPIGRERVCERGCVIRVLVKGLWKGLFAYETVCLLCR